MIPFITVKLVHRDLELQPDADGEMREIAVDAVMELDIRLYEEEEVELLSDLYALDREVIPVRRHRGVPQGGAQPPDG